ncbi:Wound-induced protein, Wun1 [Heracleum sosnowskyi]|uniref:Wound-induced protein, Wun1 n=1 Tax=Heracleum sosnowskyi TaxID=360622 RepID=A0AAD8J933_9APIA|nr:Wound-induced protein, Wun1 [Heracleum sosnowskyi]
MDAMSPVSDLEKVNKATVDGLYKALASGDTKRVAAIVGNDIEWWFHGPPKCHHMMRVLTGESSYNEFKFEPRSITAVGDRIIVEGYEGASVYWVHVWTVNNGAVTQFREYFNTWLTVKELRPLSRMVRHHGSTLWRSQPRDLFKRSLPALMLAM